MEWAVATTQPACEAKASADLVSVGFTAYYPKIENIEAVRGRIVKRPRPLFPGYLFFCQIGVPLAHAWHWVFGVSERITGVLMWNPDEPARLSQDVMDDLQGRAGPDGVIKVESRRKRRFNVGATVSAKMPSPFAGFNGIVERLESKDRISVLFELFGRKTTVTMREADITAG